LENTSKIVTFIASFTLTSYCV